MIRTEGYFTKKSITEVFQKMATKSYEVVLFPDKSSKATFFRVQSQSLCKGFTSSFLFLTVVELAEFLFVSLSNDCSQDLLKRLCSAKLLLYCI